MPAPVPDTVPVATLKMPTGVFLSDIQKENAKVLGMNTNAEGGVYDGGAGEMRIVYDSRTNTRRPAFIRVQNMHASEPLKMAEDLRDANDNPICSATLFTGVLACGSATDDGTGGGIEYTKERPSCVAVYGVNAWRAVILVRYVDSK